MSSRRFGPPVLVLALLAGVAAGVGATALVLRRPTATGAATADSHAHGRYVCPMHPTISSDKPGECPICGMQLVPANDAAATRAAAPAERRLLFYRSPMDPKQTSPTPRKDEMGMDYLPVYSDEVGGATASVPGLATVGIDPQRQQLIGLRTAPVVEGQVGGSWRTVGRVAVDETRVHHASLKFSGFIEQVFVDYVGKQVRAGEPLFRIYSPDVASAEEEYLLALRTREALGPGAKAAGGDDLVAAARERLKLWDIPEAEIRRLERTGKAQRAVTIFAPMSGVVTKKDAVMGHRVADGDAPYEITDLSQVWVLADAYESDLARVRLGTPALLTLQAFPNREFPGKVVFIDPILDPKTRTAKVRLAFPNPTGELKPEMFGEVTLRTPARRGLSIPTDAIIDSGTRKVVFVSLGEGKFRPQEVRIGASDGDRSEVLDGLKAGDQVVTRANFLVDSESRLRASLGALEGAAR
ncbi:MAG TPA: efflux RND transporter periplasmic adaptor subunit [Myxococcaceae bacterium]|nr:efflux RND transporter periplasmic adaptor subunit [Myxococcaceae bacterium]